MISSGRLNCYCTVEVAGCTAKWHEREYSERGRVALVQAGKPHEIEKGSEEPAGKHARVLFLLKVGKPPELRSNIVGHEVLKFEEIVLREIVLKIGIRRARPGSGKIVKKTQIEIITTGRGSDISSQESRDRLQVSTTAAAAATATAEAAARTWRRQHQEEDSRRGEEIES